MDFAQDENGDLALENGDLVPLTGKDEIKQDLEQRLTLQMGTWFMDLSDGIPYLFKINRKNPNISEIETLLIEEILETPNVIEIMTLNLSYEPGFRKLNVKADVDTTEGKIELDI